MGLTNTGTQQDVDAWIAMFAAMLGKPDRAVQMKARSDEELNAIKVEAAARTGGPEHPLLQQVQRRPQGRRRPTATTTSTSSSSGHTTPPPARRALQGTGMVGVDVEQVLAWDPEIILLGNFDDAMPADVYGNPVWQSVSAVRSRRVYKVPLGGYRWDPPGQESPLMWRWLTDISFPSGNRLRSERTATTSTSCTATSHRRRSWTRSSGPRPTAPRPTTGSSMLREAQPLTTGPPGGRGPGLRRVTVHACSQDAVLAAVSGGSCTRQRPLQRVPRPCRADPGRRE